MKRLGFLAALSMLTMLILAPTALAQGIPDCAEVTDDQAQQILAEGGDFGILDTDGDGVACEADQPVFGANDGVCVGPGEADPDCAEALLESLENQGVPAAQSDTPQQVSCDQFVSAAGNPSQFQAQQFFDFEATAAQQAALDADGDGFACDALETGVDNLGITDAERAASQQETPAQQAPVATDDGTQMQEMPDTGGPGLLAPLAALLVGSGVLGLAWTRRRNS